MSGKKSKKTKGKTIPLQDFLGDTPGGVPTNPKMKSWADATEDDEDYGGYSTRKNDPVVLPTAPRAARDQSINEENIPRDPPYVAYISNLPYDVEEEDLNEFFAGMNIASMRLPKDANKFKGYGYIDFQDRESLIAALNMIDTTLKSRRVRIEVSNSSNDDRRGRMGRMGRDYGDDPERTSGDWRSARATDDNDDGGRDDRFRSRGFDRNREDRDSGFEDHKPTTGNWRDGPREAAADRPRPSFRESRPTGDDREWRVGGGGGGGGGGFGDRRGGPPRDGSRGREPGSGFGGRRYDDFERDKERWSSIRSQPRDSADAPSSDAPRMRPKLNLAPPSKPRENKDNTEEPSGRAADQPRSITPTPATNIFGAAKPVDTAAREREIEERLAKSAEARREDDHDRRREGAWGRRNGEESDSRSRPTWRSSQPPSRSDRDQRESRDSRDSRDSRESRDSNRDSRDSGEPRSDSRGTSGSRSGAQPTSRASSRHNDSRPPPDGAEREKKKDSEEDELSRMPKAKEDQAPNFVASNKYSMLPDDVDPDNIEE